MPFKFKHGREGEPIYKIWGGMIGRCTNLKNAAYADYGGRGIKVCERWRDFRNFLADMGERPAGTTLDRIDNDGNYEPGNCRWATRAEQARNRRSNRKLTHNGRTQLMSDWAMETGINIQAIQIRLDRLGWTIEKALTTPSRGRPRKHARYA